VPSHSQSHDQSGFGSFRAMIVTGPCKLNANWAKIKLEY
jgi:hypothetical protein